MMTMKSRGRDAANKLGEVGGRVLGGQRSEHAEGRVVQHKRALHFNE
jgi:hypothetical protein